MSWKRISLGAVLAVFVAATTFAAVPGDVERERWLRVDTTQLVVRSELPRIETAGLVRALDRFRLAMLERFDAGDRHIPPTHVFLFASAESLAPYNLRAAQGPGPALGGFSASTPLADYIVVNAGDTEQGLRLLRHEYIHVLLHHLTGPLPRWFHEGVAEHFAMARLRGDQMSLGVPSSSLQRLREQDWLPFEGLTSLVDATRLSPELRGLFYAQSWLVADYLISTHEGTLEELADRARALSREPDGAAARALGLDRQHAEATLRAYLKRLGPVRMGTDPVAVLDARPVHTVRVRRSSLLSRLGEMLLFAHRDYAAAEAHFLQAVESSPDRAFGAMAGLGYLQLVHGDDRNARELFVNVSSQRPALLRPHQLRGLGCLERHEVDAALAPGTPPRGPWIDCARSAFSTVLELSPDSAEALAALGSSYLNTADPPGPGITFLERARDLSPARLDVAAYLAALYAAEGRMDVAEPLLRQIAARGNRAMVSRSWQLQAWARRRQVDPLVRAGQIDEAVQRLTELARQVPDPAARARLDADLERLRERSLQDATGGTD